MKLSKDAFIFGVALAVVFAVVSAIIGYVYVMASKQVKLDEKLQPQYEIVNRISNSELGSFGIKSFSECKSKASIFEMFARTPSDAECIKIVVDSVKITLGDVKAKEIGQMLFEWKVSKQIIRTEKDRLRLF